MDANLVIQDGTSKGLMGSDVHEGVVLALEIVVAILGILAFAAWVPVFEDFRGWDAGASIVREAPPTLV